MRSIVFFFISNKDVFYDSQLNLFDRNQNFVCGLFKSKIKADRAFYKALKKEN